MDAAVALSELTELNATIERAALLDGDGSVLAATPEVDAGALARDALELLEVAAGAHSIASRVARVQVSLATASVFALRAGGRVAVAITGPEPVAGLVLHDLRTCLDKLETAAPRPRRVKPTTEAPADA